MAKKLDPMAWGSNTMSQRDTMGKAMSKAYKNTKTYGMPRGAAMKSAAKNAASKLMGGLGAK